MQEQAAAGRTVVSGRILLPANLQSRAGNLIKRKDFGRSLLRSNRPAPRPFTNEPAKNPRDCIMHGPDPHKELEVKLELPSASIGELKKNPHLRTLKVAPKHPTEVSVYFDTDKHKLRKRGLMLRVRRVGSHYLQTIKASGNLAPFERGEWETEIAGNEPDLSLAKGTALEPLMTKKLRRQLRPLFKTRVQRTVYPLVDDAHAIALTVDRGTIDAGTRTLPLCEIELELKRGTVGELFEVARELIAALPVRLAVKSKSERGYEIIDGELALPVRLTLSTYQRAQVGATLLR
jgi:inorganic triphosphatase YgiF